ncbi:MAG: type I-E CRISPR-associated protein Cse1/CasA [Desulfosarcinaceae bacterium]
MSRYNLVDEKWIPVRFPDGTRDELGIRDTLLRSKEIAVIEDPSPLVVAALHRFLLAVLYRALEGPTDISQAKGFFRNGLPHDKLKAYLEKWHDRFWLFDDKFPFGQIPNFEPKMWRAWTALAAEHNADNAKVLFDHVKVEAPGKISGASASRWILATQTFAVSCGKSELAHTGTAPSAAGVMAIPVGRDLQDTLLFMLVPQNRELFVSDFAIWEKTPESLENLKAGIKRTLCGLADRYTWRTRSIRLLLNKSGTIEKLAFASGIDTSSEDQTDPMLGYRVDEKKGKLPMQFRDRGFWRDFDSLLPDESHLAPKVIEHAISLSKFDMNRFPSSVVVLGQANDKAKIKYWRMELFVLPGALAGDRFIRAEIRQLLIEAEEAQKRLWLACRNFARNLLSRGERQPAKKDINAFIDQMPTIDTYWSALEPSFQEILHQYTIDRNPEDIRCLWLKFIRDSLKKAWWEHRSAVSTGDAWAIRALVRSEVPVLQKIKKLKNEIEKLEPRKEAA